MIIVMCDPSSKSRVGAGEERTGGGDASACFSPDPQGSCAVPFVSADRAAVATQSRCRDGQEPALVRRIGASIAPSPDYLVFSWLDCGNPTCVQRFSSLSSKSVEELSFSQRSVSASLA